MSLDVRAEGGGGDGASSIGTDLLEGGSRTLDGLGRVWLQNLI